MKKLFQYILIISFGTLFLSGLASAATVLFPTGGGTGTSTPPTYGKLLVGNSAGTYTLTATSSLGISASPGGSNTQVQFNDSGSFGGDANFTWDNTSKALILGTEGGIGVLSSANAVSANTAGADFEFDGGSGNGTAKGGDLTFNGGPGGSTDGRGGDIGFTAGSAGVSNADAGNIFFSPGAKSGSGTKGHVYIQDGESPFRSAIFDTASLASSDKTFTFPNQSGTLCLVGVACDGGSGTVGIGQPGQFGFYSSSGTSLAGSFNGYASSTNFATLFGVGAGGQNATTSATQNNTTAIGYAALNALIDGARNTAVGSLALNNATTSPDNTAVGYGALMGSDSTNFSPIGLNTAIGRWAMASTTSGFANTAVGASAMRKLTTGIQNTAVGRSSMGTVSQSITGTDNTALGYLSMQIISSGIQNTAIGSTAMATGIITGSSNTVVGYTAGNGIANGSGNTLIGNQAGVNITSGYDNVVIGRIANTGGGNISTGGGNILIGYNPLVPSGLSGKNQMNIGGLLFANGMATSSNTTSASIVPAGLFGVGTTTPFATLSVGGVSTADPLAVATSSTATLVFGIDKDGHRYSAGPAPTISSCGTGTGTVVGDDSSGTITTATAATACTMTFSKAYASTPNCRVTDNSLVGFADISSISSSAVTFGISSALTGGLLYYDCTYHHL